MARGIFRPRPSYEARLQQRRRRLSAAFSVVPPPSTQTVSPDGLVTSQAFGTASIQHEVQHLTNISGVVTAEVFGDATLRMSVARVVGFTLPTAAQIADVLSLRYGVGTIRFRYYRYLRDGTLIDDISSSITDPGSITLDNRRAVQRDLTIEIDLSLLPSDYDFARHVIGIVFEVYIPAANAWASISVGRFMLDVSETHYRDSTTHLKCQGSDLVMALVRSTRSAPYTIPSGSNYINSVAEILGRHGIPYSLVSSSIATPQAFTWGPGVNDYTIVRDMLMGVNYYPIWADANGVLKSRERVAPSSEPTAVLYRDTAEPMMVSGETDYVTKKDIKPANRCVVIIDDPRNADYGYVQRENADENFPNSTGSLTYGLESTISGTVAASAYVITTLEAHDLQTDVTVLIKDHSGSTPDINGSHIITKVSDTAFSIPVAVTVAGTGGTVQPTITQMLVLNGDSDPPTKCVANATVAADIAEYELQYAAMLSQTAEMATLLDPRREAHEWYTLNLEGIESSTLWGVLDWKLPLDPGKEMTHTIGMAGEVTLLSPPKI